MKEKDWNKLDEGLISFTCYNCNKEIRSRWHDDIKACVCSIKCHIEFKALLIKLGQIGK